MHITEKKKTVPGLGFARVPEGHIGRQARVTTHPAALEWWLSLTSQQRGEIARAAWDAAGQPTVETVAK